METPHPLLPWVRGPTAPAPILEAPASSLPPPRALRAGQWEVGVALESTSLVGWALGGDWAGFPQEADRRHPPGFGDGPLPVSLGPQASLITCDVVIDVVMCILERIR